MYTCVQYDSLFLTSDLQCFGSARKHTGKIKSPLTSTLEQSGVEKEADNDATETMETEAENTESEPMVTMEAEAAAVGDETTVEPGATVCTSNRETIDQQEENIEKKSKKIKATHSFFGTYVSYYHLITTIVYSDPALGRFPSMVLSVCCVCCVRLLSRPLSTHHTPLTAPQRSSNNKTGKSDRNGEEEKRCNTHVMYNNY